MFAFTSYWQMQKEPDHEEVEDYFVRKENENTALEMKSI